MMSWYDSEIMFRAIDEQRVKRHISQVHRRHMAMVAYHMKWCIVWSWQALDRRFEIEERASCCQTSLGAFS